ncbi:Gfo/Idh/MocA family protein [Amycolatopsis sp. YIM 10]|uniref:Gfo/Idh/MocA family protein n=1 Tax=Amycolatopsis sp. YIM 10 TaxID=2653857 RepID=UPI0012904A91|nr:Gfo/Idh/MocA family oxidoreductase [Amycolatopsis sp. YIM 10]QFU93041.1 Putative UDP-kanosamine synthase oxidoreductase subunit [Amycolatopsis sp. YIM 10]
MKTYRVAVVGLGWAGRSIWLPRLQAHPAFDVVAAVDPEAVIRSTVGREAGDLKLLSSVDELKGLSVDLAVVAVPNHLHHDVAKGLLLDGIPVFLEKPVCLSSAEVDSLAAAERAGRATLLAGSAANFRADVLALHDLRKELGHIRHLELTWIRARGVPSGDGWFTDRRYAGGGALVDLGWHLLDVAGPLLGDAEIDEVVGSVSADFVNDSSRGAVWRHDAGTGAHGDVEDTANAFLVTDDGTSVLVRASWASHEQRDVTTVTVHGSEGTARLRCTFGFSPNREGSAVLSLTCDGETVVLPVPEEPIGSEYDRQLNELPGLLADPAAQGRAIEDARKTVRVIEGVYGSVRRRSLRRPA